MGTNYYAKKEPCPTCGHAPESIHLGKSSMGWQFSFQYNGGRYYKNVEEMREWLKDKSIFDEYGEKLSHEEFWKIVAAKQKPEFKNHAQQCRKEKSFGYLREMVIDGYSFTDANFC